MSFLVLALLVTPLLTFFVYRLAKGLGFLDPPWNAEHEQRRTIVVALFAFVLFLSVFLFGHANAWPRVWAVFGVFNAVALLFFGVVGVIAARRLWRLRHPKPLTGADEPPAAPPDPRDPGSPAETPLA
jgi:hypothetical protein